MAKKKKNANYVTEKTVQKKQEAEAAARRAGIKSTVITVLVCVLAVAVLAGAVIGIGAIFGMFDYNPEPTGHASIAIEGYGTLHVELYGNDAPETVKQFEKLVEAGYFDGKDIYCILDGKMYLGGQTTPGHGTVVGEFAENGKENEISHKRGTLSMLRGEDFDSGDGRFFIVTENQRELDGSYAAFGRISDGLDILDKILKDAKTDENGYLTDPPLITSVSTHASH